MTKLPSVSGRECIGALEKVGFHVKRQEGGHIILRRDDPFAQTVVPLHKELDGERCGPSYVKLVSVLMSSSICCDFLC
jgi:predicted RNA binding protein YcfA (HicA-like mRNA interferase family)